MIFEDTFPRPTGASDFEDSSMLGGIMNLFGHPEAPPLIFNYINALTGKYRRCINSKYSFSRDQFVCLIAGMKACGYDAEYPELISIDRVDGKDFMSPTIKGHVERCKGGQASWFQDLFFWADLYFSAKFKPLDELNQLFCMMYVADPKFIKWYCSANSQWEQAVKNYWCENDGAWRAEPELAALMIEKIKAKAAK